MRQRRQNLLLNHHVTVIIMSDPRSQERINYHYLIEKELATRLREASAEDRRNLYTNLYNELFQKVLDHPQHLDQANSVARTKAINKQMRLLRPFLRPDTVFLEIGTGDCALAISVAEKVQKVYALDVSPEISKNANLPNNVEFVLSHGDDIPIPNESITLAYSYQLMEHLHPEDAMEQLKAIYQALKAGSKYICLTPNVLAGPHDISKYFDTEATGFHIKEYSATELEKIMLAAGFSKISAMAGGKGYYINFPLSIIKWCEQMLFDLPLNVQKAIAKTPLLRAILGVIFIAEK